MNSLLYYNMKVSSVFVVLYLIYCLLFSRLTFHYINRFLLIFMLPLSALIPFLNLGFNRDLSNNIPIPKFNEIQFLNQPHTGLISEFSPEMRINLFRVLTIIYCLGLAFYVLRLVSNAFKLILTRLKSPHLNNNGLLLFSTKVPLVFSCFNWIFIPETENNNCEETIIRHEKLHASLWHTVDLILTEIFIAFLWFNPFVYFFRKSIKSVHEFQVDSLIVNAYGDKEGYLKLILQNLDLKYRQIGIYNYFNGLIIKKRITMITNKKSSKIKLFRYLLFIPVLAILILSFTNPSGQKPELFPIKEGDYSKITCQFGQKMNNPFTKKETIHQGIDIKAAEGIKILSTAGGKVKKISEEEGWGKLIIIDHGDGIESWYAHLKAFQVKEGEIVKQGQVVGYVGNTGYSTGPHLHFEIRQNGKSVDPLIYLKK